MSRLLRLCSTFVADRSSLDTTQAKLQVLYDKQGRAQRFTTQAQRDKFLNDDIKSLKAYEKAQSKRVEELRKDLEEAKTQLAEAMQRSEEHERSEEERRDNLRKMSEEVTALKKKVDDMAEQRK